MVLIIITDADRRTNSASGLRHPAEASLFAIPSLRPIPATLAVVFALVAAGSRAQPVVRPVPISIPAQALGAALDEWARQTRIAVAVSPALVAGRLAPAVYGTMPPREALDRLLAGSGLSASSDGDGVAVRPAPAASSEAASPPLPAAAAPALPAVRVTAGAPAAQGGPPSAETGYRSVQQSSAGFTAAPILDTPFQVNSIPAEVFRDQQARSLVEVVLNDPSVSEAGTPPWYDRVQIRGFYLGTDSYFRDGLAMNDQATTPLDNKAAIEILKGPTALRYGFTSPGGIVNYVLKRPTEEPFARVRLFGDGFGGVGLGGDVGGRFGERREFGVRINAAREQERTYIDDVRGDRTFFSTYVDWRVTDRLLLEAEYESQRRELTDFTQIGLDNFATLDEARATLERVGPRTFVGQRWATYPTSNTFYGARATWRIDESWTARVAVQQQYLNRDQNGIGPGTVQPNGDFDAFYYYSPDQDRNTLAVQAYVNGRFRTGRLGHDLVAGIDHTRRTMTYPDGYYDVIGFSNLYAPVPIANPRVSSDPSYLASRSDASSVFVTDTVTLSSAWQVFGGLRHTRPDFRSFNSDGTSAGDPYRKGATSPSAGVVFKPSENVSIYTSYAEGIEQGGAVPADFDGLPYANAGEVLPPLQSRQLELGAKAEVLQDLLVSAAVFGIEKSLEINRYSAPGSVERVQDGRQVHRGLELTAGGRVTSGLRVIGGLMWLDATIRDADDPSIAGNRPTNVPEYQASLFGDYHLSALAPGLYVNGGVFHSGRRAFDEQNTLFADGFTRIDLGARYQTRVSGRLATFRIGVQNVADAKYLSNTSFGTFGFGAPRTVRFSAEFDL
jgi:iron complex outermembrane receptor protein